MRKTLLLSIILLSSMPGIQKSLIAQEKTSLNQVVNTLKGRISLAGSAQLGYTYDDAAKPDNTFDIKRIIFMAHGKITKRWTCDFTGSTICYRNLSREVLSSYPYSSY